VFRVEDTWLALDARVVESVLEDQGCTPVPGAPPHVLGVIVHGERVLALFDVATFCGVAPRADSYNGFPRTFIVHAGGFTVGIRADLAAGVVDVAAPDIVAVAALQGERLVPYLLGEVKTPWGLAGLLDTARILEDACVRE
jgi:purine-binding chemotaxis protein CheW